MLLDLLTSGLLVEKAAAMTTARTFGLTSTSTWIESAVASVESRCASVASLRTFTATEIANAPVTSMPLACGAVFCCCGCTVSLGIEKAPPTSARMLPFVSAATLRLARR